MEQCDVIKQHSFPLRLARCLFGLLLYGLGLYFNLQANIGLAPWEAFHAGIELHTPFSFGTVSIICGILILCISVLLKEKIGIGTVLNTVLIGVFIDMFRAIGFLPLNQRLLPGIVLLLIGQVFVCCGSYFYMQTAMGCGPRDSLMVALGRRLPRIPMGAIRATIEGCALLIGWLLGGKVGLGTILSVFGIGFILQATFRLLRFDARSVRHESILQTLRGLRPAPAEPLPEEPLPEEDKAPEALS